MTSNSYRDTQKNDPDVQTQIPKHLQKNGRSDSPSRFYPDDEIWAVMIFCKVDNCFLRSGKKESFFMHSTENFLHSGSRHLGNFLQASIEMLTHTKIFFVHLCNLLMSPNIFQNQYHLLQTDIFIN